MIDNYFDIDGKPTTLDKLVRTEPEWAANRIHYERKENKKLLALLVSIEWAGSHCESYCVVCGETKSFGHDENCELAEVLK